MRASALRPSVMQWGTHVRQFHCPLVVRGRCESGELEQEVGEFDRHGHHAIVAGGQFPYLCGPAFELAVLDAPATRWCVCNAVDMGPGNAEGAEIAAPDWLL